MKNPNNIKISPATDESNKSRFANDTYSASGSIQITSYDHFTNEYAIILGWEADCVSKREDLINKTGLVPPYNEED
jgi:hypothetical protein